MAGSISTPAARVVAWQRRHGRHDLPWQYTRDAYRIWLSEVMLQQTQVATVIPYYQRFLEKFPDVRSLARAPLDEVLALWSGLGYYSRARHLHLAARLVVARHGGEFPRDPLTLRDLPGVGRSTAAAIAVAAYGGRHAILDGNVKRVLARYRGVYGYPGKTDVQERLWREAEALLPVRGIEAYTQGLMDLGNAVCTRRQPRCDACPLALDCVAHAQGLTQKLPEAKPRAAIPERKTVMLVIRADGKLLLEKRPEKGVWGGLWSLPETDQAKEAAPHCREMLGMTVLMQKKLPSLTHVFTHFKLRITPVLLEVKPVRLSQSQSSEKRWYSKSAALAAGISKPVRDIITHCF